MSDEHSTETIADPALSDLSSINEVRAALQLVLIFGLLTLLNVGVFSVLSYGTRAESIEELTSMSGQNYGMRIEFALVDAKGIAIADMATKLEAAGIKEYRIISEKVDVLHVGPNFKGLTDAGDPNSVLPEDRIQLDLAIQRFQWVHARYTVRLHRTSNRVIVYGAHQGPTGLVVIQAIAEEAPFSTSYNEMLRNLLIAAGVMLALHTIFLIFSNLFFVKPIRKAREMLQSAYSSLKALLDMKEYELEMARTVQQAILPVGIPEFDNFKLGYRYHPMHKVSGDIVDFYIMDDGSLLFFLGDVSGHGIPSAMVTTMAKVSFRNGALGDMTPWAICHLINQDLSATLGKTTYYLTGFVGRLHLDGRLEYSNATHPDPVLFSVDKSKEYVEIGPTGFFLGVIKEVEFEANAIPTQNGSRIVIFSDGVTEAENDAGEYLGEAPVYQLLAENRNTDIEKTLDLVDDLVKRHRDGKPPTDDVTVLVIDFALKPSA